MTDSRLQQLKRAWEASGSLADEAAWLRERVRAGELTQEELQLAAYCGSEAAAFGSLTDGINDREWLEGLARWKDHLWVLLAVSPVSLEVGRSLIMQQENRTEGYLKNLARNAAAYERYLLSSSERQKTILRENPGMVGLLSPGFYSLLATPGKPEEVRRVVCEVVTDCVRHGPRRRLAAT